MRIPSGNPKVANRQQFNVFERASIQTEIFKLYSNQHQLLFFIYFLELARSSTPNDKGFQYHSDRLIKR